MAENGRNGVRVGANGPMAGGLGAWLFTDAGARERLRRAAVALTSGLRNLPGMLSEPGEVLRLPRRLADLLEVASRQEVAELRQRVALLEQQVRRRRTDGRPRRAAPPA